MSKTKAVKYYEEKYNCAQAILKAFGGSDEQVERCAKCGGGRAEGGVCGALYAGSLLLDDSEKKEKLVAYFADKAAATTCRDVRKAKKLSCALCVERVADFLERESG